MKLEESRIIFLGDFEGGDLHFEDGTTFNETKRWFSFDPQTLHWNSPITAGDKYSIVAYKHPKLRSVGEIKDPQEDKWRTGSFRQ